MGFLVIADGKVKAQECGSEGEVCCQENNQWKCDSDNLMCVQYGNDFQCVPKPNDTSLIGTCKCDSVWYNSSKCLSIDNNNYCDASQGDQPFCITNRDQKCGPDMNFGSLDNTCKCKTQEEASQDPELNGYNKNYEPGTCIVGVETRGFGSIRYFVAHNYCNDYGGFGGGKKQEAKLYSCVGGGQGAPVCECVDEGYMGKSTQGCSLLSESLIIKNPGDRNTMITKYLYGTDYKLYCEDKGDDENPYIQTSLGCIPVTVKSFVAWLLPILFSIAGTVAFLIMVGGFIALATSEGDPKKMQAARETITAAVTGLLISIFSIFIVRLIIVYILKIPGA